MKKTDFPDKCSACRLANRDRMRQELATGGTFYVDKPREKQGKFEDIAGQVDVNFPTLPPSWLLTLSIV